MSVVLIRPKTACTVEGAAADASRARRTGAGRKDPFLHRALDNPAALCPPRPNRARDPACLRRWRRISCALIDYVADSRAPRLAVRRSVQRRDDHHGALDRLSDACASAFAALGVTRGDRVSAAQRPQFFIAQFGAGRSCDCRAATRSTPSTSSKDAARAWHPHRRALTRFYQRRTQRKAACAASRAASGYIPPLLRLLQTFPRDARDRVTAAGRRLRAPAPRRTAVAAPATAPRARRSASR